MIRLGNEDVREEVGIRSGSRYAILKVINGTHDGPQRRMELSRARSRDLHSEANR
jgi:hypothetical protein